MPAAADYAAILSNPPLHKGIAEDHALLEQLIADAPAHLAPGGCLQIVVQRRIPLDRLLAKHFAERDGRGRERPLSRLAGTPSPSPRSSRGEGSGEGQRLRRSKRCPSV